MSATPPIDLSRAPGSRESWDRPLLTVLLWALVEILVVRNSLQLSSRLRISALRRFGATIGQGVIARPGLRVRFPWKLTVGDRSWIGEDVWLHNQDQLVIGTDVVISQDTFVTTGTHAFRTDMALRTRPIRIDDGAWVTSRCMVLGGSHIGRSALILPNTVVKGSVPPNAIYGSDTAQVVGQRFPDESSEPAQER
ncbi:putative colanic acid biosynthesis acetyltransferase WcaF [Nocardioides salarius]|uniref:Colanic acid biosynthesis acetyltransferase WcaF n=1 Tax=Nocardioides salarius TaxID=374513 RepID=A0ABS2M907_9ACTN|nr:acetyltransferase [Nocardioides salarius]MBM7507670.1 putative colanic acid biosynthesis acetyltransferase WcaF [Nocardioides salarius]